mgnify:CR=1 FL=1
MNPLKSNNIVAKILQVYAYVNAFFGMILATALKHELGALLAWIMFALTLVASFFIFALGEIIDLLQNLKENTNGGREVSDELPEL